MIRLYTLIYMACMDHKANQRPLKTCVNCKHADARAWLKRINYKLKALGGYDE